MAVPDVRRACRCDRAIAFQPRAARQKDVTRRRIKLIFVKAGTGGGLPEQAARRTLTALAQLEGALQSFEQTISK